MSRGVNDPLGQDKWVLRGSREPANLGCTSVIAVRRCSAAEMSV